MLQLAEEVDNVRNRDVLRPGGGHKAESAAPQGAQVEGHFAPVPAQAVRYIRQAPSVGLGERSLSLQHPGGAGFEIVVALKHPLDQ